MSYEIKKVAELEYNELVTLAVIENDEDLSSIFSEDVNMSYSLLKTLAQDNKLSDETKEILYDIFEGLILTTQRHANNYVRFGGIPISNGFIKDKPIEVELTKLLETTSEPKLVKVKKERKISKWYGKERLVKEIAEQGGEANPTQRAMLELNELKNIYSKLLTKGIKDLETGSEILSEEDCRTIESTILILKRRLNKVLNKKK